MDLLKQRNNSSLIFWKIKVYIIASFTYITEPSSKLSTSGDDGRGQKPVEHTSHLGLECLSNEKEEFKKTLTLGGRISLPKKDKNAGNIRECC